MVNEIKDSENRYYNKYFIENRNNMKMMYRIIQNIIKLRANDGRNIKEIKTKEVCRLDDPVQMANSINSYFTNVANMITKSSLSFLP